MVFLSCQHARRHLHPFREVYRRGEFADIRSRIVLQIVSAARKAVCSQYHGFRKRMHGKYHLSISGAGRIHPTVRMLERAHILLIDIDIVYRSTTLLSPRGHPRRHQEYDYCSYHSTHNRVNIRIIFIKAPYLPSARALLRRRRGVYGSICPRRA